MAVRATPRILIDAFSNSNVEKALRATIGLSREDSEAVGGLSFAHDEAHHWTSERARSDLIASGDGLDYL